MNKLTEDIRRKVRMILEAEDTTAPGATPTTPNLPSGAPGSMPAGEKDTEAPPDMAGSETGTAGLAITNTINDFKVFLKKAVGEGNDEDKMRAVDTLKYIIFSKDEAAKDFLNTLTSAVDSGSAVEGELPPEGEEEMPSEEGAEEESEETPGEEDLEIPEMPEDLDDEEGKEEDKEHEEGETDEEEEEEQETEEDEEKEEKKSGKEKKGKKGKK